MEFLVVARDHDLHHRRQFKAHQDAYTRAGIDPEQVLLWLVYPVGDFLLGTDPLYWREERMREYLDKRVTDPLP